MRLYIISLLIRRIRIRSGGERGESSEVQEESATWGLKSCRALYGALHAVVSISLTTRELEIINKVMETEGKSRSEAIRTLIRRGWAYTRLLEDEERLRNEPSA